MDASGAKKKLLSTTDGHGLCLAVHVMAEADKPERGVSVVLLSLLFVTSPAKIAHE